LLDSFPEIQVSAVGRADGSRMNTAISRFAGRLEWQPVVTDMAAHMSACNVAIGSPGVATWERACIGLPAVTLATNANQRSILRDLDRDGFARFLGDLEALSDEAFVDGVRHFLGDNDALDRYREIGVNAIDGRGALRAAQTMAMVVQSD
jgi:spore coat polysaccharide biosynthesis predicted glycosyltransferase SpsG